MINDNPYKTTWVITSFVGSLFVCLSWVLPAPMEMIQGDGHPSAGVLRLHPPRTEQTVIALTWTVKQLTNICVPKEAGDLRE